jgi:hypothetical protein
LQLTLDGKKLESPYSSSLDLVNTGTKAVLTRDFDKPIEIALEDNAQVITARVTSTTPSDIPVDISTSGNVVRIAPHLSNSGDIISLNIITSGAKPVYSVRARIAGIQNVSYVDLTVPKSPYIRYLMPVAAGLAAWALFCLTLIFSFTWLRELDFGIPRLVSAFVSFTSYASGVQLLGNMVKTFELQNRWEILAPMLITSIAIAIWLSSYLLLRWQRQALRSTTQPRTQGPLSWP